MSARCVLAAALLAGCAAGAPQRSSTIATAPTIEPGACGNPLSDGVLGRKRDLRHQQRDLNDDLIPELIVTDRNACDDAANCYWNVFSIDTTGACLPYRYLGTLSGREIEVEDTTSGSFHDLRTVRFAGEDLWRKELYALSDTGTYQVARSQWCTGPDPDEATCSDAVTAGRPSAVYSLRPLVLPSGRFELSAAARTWKTDPPARSGAAFGESSSFVLDARTGLPWGDAYLAAELNLGDDPEYVGDGPRAVAGGMRFSLTDYVAVRAQLGRTFLHQHRGFATEVILATDMRVRSGSATALVFSLGAFHHSLQIPSEVMRTSGSWRVSRVFLDGDIRFRLVGKLAGFFSLYFSVPVTWYPSPSDRDPVTGTYLEEAPEYRAGAGLVFATDAHVDLWGKWQVAPAEDSEQSYTLGVRLRF